MLKNKKALTTKAIIRLLIGITAFLLLFLYPASKLYGSLFGQDEKYINSFETFVKEINNMNRLGIKPVNIKLDEESAIIGFSNDGDKFSYVSTLLSINHFEERKFFKRPDKPECKNSACICLCSDLDDEGKKLTCKNIECRSLGIDVITNTLIFVPPFLPSETIFRGIDYWKDGFLYGRSTDKNFNGLPKKDIENFLFRVEKKPIGNKRYIGICKQEWFDEIAKPGQPNFRKEFFKDRCIVTELDEVEEFEKRSADNVKNSLHRTFIPKLETFIKKYEAGREVEEAMFKIGEFYLELDKEDEAKGAFKNLANLKNPKSKFPDKATEKLVELEGTKETETS